MVRALELDSGAKLGLSVSKRLPGFEAEKPLGAGSVITNDHLFLHQKGLKNTGGWIQHYLHYGSKTKYGRLILAGTLEHFSTWAKSWACTKECAKVKRSRLSALVDGYILFVDAEKETASPKIADGEGFCVWSDGAVYKGQLRDGLSEGRGILTCASGAVQEGERHKDKVHGAGTSVYADGDVCRGQWVQGKKHGHGIYEYKESDARCSDGDWRDDKKDGKGAMHYANGDVHGGQWVQNNRHGHGIKEYKEGNMKCYDGESAMARCGRAPSTFTA